MASFKKTRSSSKSTSGGNQVRVARKWVDFDRYGELLHKHRDTVLLRTGQKPVINNAMLTLAARAMCCGSIVGSNPETPHRFERSEYCRITRLCTVCYYSNEKQKAQNQINDVEKCVGMRLLGYVFTTPAPTSHAQAVHWARIAGNVAQDALVAAIERWRSRRGDHYRIGHYVMGCHAKLIDRSPHPWSHLHLAIFVDPSCPVAGDDGISAYLTAAFHHVTDVTPPPIVKCKNYFRLTEITPHDASRKKHNSGSAGLAEKAINLFAYVTRYVEEDDTPQFASERDSLFADAGIQNPNKRSRRRSLADCSRTALSNKFPVDILGKNGGFVFPLDGSDPRPIDPTNFSAEMLAMQTQAMDDLQHAFSHRLVQ